MDDRLKTITERAVAQLKAYAKYIDEHAENIIGNIDKPNYVTNEGIRISFTLLAYESAPILEVSKDYLAMEVLEVNR